MSISSAQCPLPPAVVVLVFILTGLTAPPPLCNTGDNLGQCEDNFGHGGDNFGHCEDNFEQSGDNSPVDSWTVYPGQWSRRTLECGQWTL